MVNDVKIILGKECFTQHRLLVVNVKLSDVVYLKGMVNVWQIIKRYGKTKQQIIFVEAEEKERRGGTCEFT